MLRVNIHVKMIQDMNEAMDPWQIILVLFSIYEF
jgi:hypothetical protein